MTNTKKQPENTITREGKKLWVNGKHNCLGRFAPMGWEIYRAVNAPTEVVGPTGTIVCRVRELTPKDWGDFVLLMKEHHNIDLSGEENPLG